MEVDAEVQQSRRAVKSEFILFHDCSRMETELEVLRQCPALLVRRFQVLATQCLGPTSHHLHANKDQKAMVKLT